MDGCGKLLPVHEVLAHGVAPGHVLPVTLIGVVLIEEVIFAVVVHQAVGVVDPSAAGGEMHLRAVGLVVYRSLVGNFRLECDEVDALEAVGIGDGDFLALVGAHVAEGVVFGFAVLRYAHHHGHVLKARDGHLETHAVEFMAYGHHHVAVGDFEGAFGSGSRHCNAHAEGSEK